MRLLSFELHNVRSIAHANLSFSKGLNIIQGVNGSGKTTLLEALYHLSTGNSFKSREAKKIIRMGEDFLSVRGELSSFSTLAIQKFTSNKTPIVKVNGDVVRSASELARCLPMQIIHEGIFDILNSGSMVRRRFLDWGLFHVEPSYHQLLSAYNHALTQKNALLKSPYQEKGLLDGWDHLLAEYGGSIHQYRAAYFSKLLPVFYNVLDEIKPELSLDITYVHGWGQSIENFDKTTLMKALIEARERDLQQKYSSKGAHKADIKFYFNKALAKENLSRGQQKIALIALMMAQAKLISEECLFLLDDLSAELDVQSIESICNYFNEQQHQVVITTLDTAAPLFKSFASESFTIHDGKVSRETLSV